MQGSWLFAGWHYYGTLYYLGLYQYPMNQYLCLVCDRPAVRVCVHPKCDKKPFLCGDKCKDKEDLAISVHTHDNRTQLITVEEMMQKVSRVQNFSHVQHLNLMRKRVNLLIGDLNTLMNRYNDELSQLELKLNSRAKDIINNISVKENNKHLKGKDLGDLLRKGDIYQNQMQTENLIEKLKALMEVEVKKLEGGIKNLLNALSVSNIKKAQEHFSKGQKLRQLGKIKEALEEYSLARKCNTLEPLYVSKLGYCYSQLNDNEKAIRHYEERILMGGAVEELAISYYNMGVIHNKKGEYGRAIESYSRALELNSDYSNCFCARGLAYSNMKRYEEAVKDYSKAIEANGNKATYYGNRGSAYESMSRLKQAAQDFTRAIEIQPTKAYYNTRANVYEKMGEQKKAQSDRNSAQTAPQK